MQCISFCNLDPYFKDLIKKCVGAVEATSYERHCIWAEYSPLSKRRVSFSVKTWIDNNTGVMFTAGTVGNHPVTIEMYFSYIDDQWVLFYNPCSRVVDYDIVNEWLKHELSHTKQTDAMNFHNILNHIKDMNQEKKNA